MGNRCLRPTSSGIFCGASLTGLPVRVAITCVGEVPVLIAPSSFLSEPVACEIVLAQDYWDSISSDLGSEVAVPFDED